MSVDKVALIFVIIATLVWGVGMAIGIVNAGAVGLIALIPVVAIAYLSGVVVSQRLSNREDDYYDKVEK